MHRRCLILLALLFWLGGSTFYAAVVIPTGLSVLKPSSYQTFITQAVTNYLNLACAVALILFVWDVFATRDAPRRWQCVRWLCCVIIGGTLGAMVWLHPRLDALMDREHLVILDRDAMRPLHIAYLGLSGAQWLAGLVLAVLTLNSWHAEDVRSIDRESM